MNYNGKIYRSINTCLDCPDRHLGCHDPCEKYQKALAEWKTRKKEIRIAKGIERQYDNYKCEAMKRFNKE